jgi:hypothetical protein
MNLYNLALFIHILGAFGLVAALAVESIALRGLGAAREVEGARPWLGAMRTLRILTPASLAVILVMGLYLMASAWGGKGWILMALAGLVLIGAIGGVLTGTRMAKIGPALERASGPLSPDLMRMLRDPALVISLTVRMALVVGILFLMSIKPSLLLSLVVLAIAAGLGLLASQLGSRSRELQRAS